MMQVSGGIEDVSHAECENGGLPQSIQGSSRCQGGALQERGQHGGDSEEECTRERERRAQVGILWISYRDIEEKEPPEKVLPSMTPLIMQEEETAGTDACKTCMAKASLLEISIHAETNWLKLHIIW